MVEIYLVRHSESEANLCRSFAGRTDVDISEKGKLQLECLSKAFKNIKLDRVYTSSLKRAYKTAEAINKYSETEVIVDDAFIEINLGVLDGKPVDDMTDEQKYNWNNQIHLFRVENGETMYDVRKRVETALNKVASENDGKVIAIASHGGVIRNLIAYIKGVPTDRLNTVNWCDNTGINHIYYDNGKFILDYENKSEHLSSEAKAIPVSSWSK